MEKKVVICYVNGQRRAGKDTFIKYISTILETEFNFQTLQLSFTDIAKSIIMTIDYESYIDKDEDTRKLLADLIKSKPIRSKTIDYFRKSIDKMLKKHEKIAVFIIGRDYELSTNVIREIGRKILKEYENVRLYLPRILVVRNKGEISNNFDESNFDSELYNFIIENSGSKKDLLQEAQDLAKIINNQILFEIKGY